MTSQFFARFVFPGALVLAASVAFAGCGGGGGLPAVPTAIRATQATATPTVTGGGQTAETPTGATATASATEAAVPTANLPSSSGGATATITVGGETFTITGGECDFASDGTWMAVNIGQAGSESFSLLLQSNPAAPQGARPISGGAVYTDGEIALTVEHGGSSFLLGGTGPAGQAHTVTLAGDLQSGEFEGNTLFGNQPMSGSFHC